MSEPKMISEREAALRERKAYADGVRCLFAEPEISAGAGSVANRVVSRANERYPLPKVVRPRVLYDSESNISGAQWSVSETGHLRFRESPKAPWLAYGDFLYTGYAAPLPNRVKLWAELLANPTEEVSDD